jgi:germination protein M
MRWTRIVVLLILLAVGAACGGGGEESKAKTTTAPTTSVPTSTSAPTTTTPSRLIAVRVYFARNENEKVATAGRSVEPPALARNALQALLSGPDPLERDIGMHSEIPTGTRLLGVKISDGEAIADFDARFESGGGSLSMSLRVAQVVFTLTQFDTVQHVTITIDGHSVEAIGGEGIPARELTRVDFQSQMPFILVESPVPGASVTSPITVSGMSNTFEATVNYEITDPDGLILTEGFTTATAGNGTWGSFTFTTNYTTSRSGMGEVIAFQLDAESGARRDIYEVPVQMS